MGNKCANFVCLNESRKVIGKNKVKYNFCRSCWKGRTPLVFECKQCGVLFTKDIVNIPFTCSIICKNRRKYITTGRRWYKAHPKKWTPVEKVTKICEQCGKTYKHFAKRKTRFCSINCNQLYQRQKRLQVIHA